jgi:hypothetical protein
MFTHQPVAALAAVALLALPLQALPNTDRSHGSDRGPENRLVEKYDRFAGSDENARELVRGLHNDTQIELSKGGKTTTFKPATDRMGFGNVDIALALAKASLADHGIHRPTPEQIKAALNGGTVTTRSGERVRLPGVLKLRASGMGWGQVAHKLGFKLGDVMRHHKHDHKHAHKKHDHKHAHHKHDHKHADHKHDHKHADRHDHGNHAHRPEFHRAKFERPEKVERPEKFERPNRPERPERPERHHHRR